MSEYEPSWWPRAKFWWDHLKWFILLIVALLLFRYDHGEAWKWLKSWFKDASEMKDELKKDIHK